MRKKLLLIIFSLCFSIFLVGCESKSKKTGNTIILTVDALEEDCVGVGPQKCLRIQKEGDDEWQVWYPPIEGFVYQPGFIYKIEILEEEVPNPAADGSSKKYSLIKIRSKIPG